MSASIPSGAIPRMLKWARATASLSIEDVADAEGCTTAELAEWESGHSSPTLSTLRRLAKRYKRPLIVFYLAEPPKDFNVVRDFRLLPKANRTFSTALAIALRIARERQAWAASYLEDVGAKKCDLVGSMSVGIKSRDAAATIRHRLGVSLESQLRCSSESEALSLWRRHCEASGIFTFQANGIEVAEMRGCALSNAYAPIAIVNMRDSYTARIFTLIHELVHILLGVSAITGGPTVTSKAPKAKTERFCDSVAAEVLVPRDDFLARIPPDWQNRDDDVIRDLATRYRVSRLVILRKLVDTKTATMDYLDDKWPMFASYKPKPRSTKGRSIPQDVIALARRGESFTRLVLSAYEAGAIHGGTVSDMLNLKLKYLPDLTGKLYPSRVQSSKSA